MSRNSNIIHTGIAALILIGMATLRSEAKGRRPDYEDSPAYAPNRVQRGSAANPNAAFNPPHFDDHPALSSTNPAAPPASRPPQERRVNRSPADNPPAYQKDGTPTPGTSPLSDKPQPPPKAVPSPVDASEPALPDYPTDDNTGKASADLLSKPSAPPVFNPKPHNP